MRTLCAAALCALCASARHAAAAAEPYFRFASADAAAFLSRLREAYAADDLSVYDASSAFRYAMISYADISLFDVFAI